MKALSLILRVLAIAAAIAAAALFFAAQGKLAEKDAQIAEARSQAQARISDVETANQEINTLQRTLRQETNALAETKRTLESVRSEMYTARQELTRAKQQMREAKSETEDLENTVERLRADLVQTEEGLNAANKEAEIAQLNERIRKLTTENENLRSDLAVAEAREQARASTGASVAAAGASGGSGSASAGSAPRASRPGANLNNKPAVRPASIGAETTIASIDSGAGIIVLEAPEALGITQGDEITLIRDLSALGRVSVLRVQDGLAVANILPGAKSRELRSGSTVKLLR